MLRKHPLGTAPVMPVLGLCKSAATRLPLNLHCSTQATRPLSSGVGPAKLCAMPVTKEEVVALLHAQGIPHMVYDHAAVMTAEAQVNGAGLDRH